MWSMKLPSEFNCLFNGASVWSSGKLNYPKDYFTSVAGKKLNPIFFKALSDLGGNLFSFNG